MKQRENLPEAAAGLVVYLVLAGLVLMGGPSPDEYFSNSGAGSSISSSDRGLGRLFAALLAEGAPVHRLAREGAEIPADTTLLVVEPVRATSPAQRIELMQALRAGEINLLIAGSFEQLDGFLGALFGERFPETVDVPEPARITAPGLGFAPRRIGVARDGPDAEGAGTAPITAFARLPSSFTAIASVAGLPVVMATPRNLGTIVVCSEPRLFENAWLGRRDNLETVLSLISARASVTFDDRWQGDDETAQREASMMALAYGTSTGRSIILTLLTAIFALYLSGLYPGGPARRKGRRRHPTEYVDALAEMYLAAGRGHEVYEHFRRRFVRRAARAAGLHPDGEPARLMAWLALRSSETEDAILVLLTQSPGPRTAAEWVARLESIQKESRT